MATKQTDPQFKLRIPAKLHGLVSEAASETGRSMNAEIVARLDASFEDGGVPAIYREAFVQGVIAGFAAAVLEEEDPIAELRRLAGKKS